MEILIDGMYGDEMHVKIDDDVVRRMYNICSLTDYKMDDLILLCIQIGFFELDKGILSQMADA